MWSKLLIVISFFVTGLSYAQFGNEWINYDQQHYSFKIHQDGVYRITYETMMASGIPVGSISPDQIQLFGFESEKPIWVEGGEDGSIDPGDAMVFYAQKNMAWLDSLMYDSPDDIANKYYPLYNDTINYYLTWNDAGGNLRFEDETDTDYPSITPQPYFWRTTHKEGNSS
ncbi:MAG: hypothetical protein ACPG21_11510 [Crocinitomicaceae bacterium]